MINLERKGDLEFPEEPKKKKKKGYTTLN